MVNNVVKQRDKSKAAFWIGLAFQKQNNLSMAFLWLSVASQFSTTFCGQLAQIFLQKVFAKYPERINHNTPFRKPNITCVKNVLVAWLSSFVPQYNEVTFGPQCYLSTYNDHVRSTLLTLIAMHFSYVDNLMLTRIYQKFLKDHAPLSLTNYPLLSNKIPSNQLHTLFSTISEKYYDFIVTLSHAIALNESSFNSNATSPAGAQGIMQLMPQTASSEVKKLINKKLLNENDKIDIYASADNLILGVSHIKTLIDEFGLNIALIAAAYNAGKHNVYKWISIFGDPRTNKISMMNWIELIPYGETRHYVQRVIEAFSVYTCILNTEHLQDIEWSFF
jgi:soluble lytic murein transglycosylase